MDIQLWDAAADAGKGAQLASGSTQLQWADWQQGAIHRQTIRLQGTGDYKVPYPKLRLLWRGVDGVQAERGHHQDTL